MSNTAVYDGSKDSVDDQALDTRHEHKSNLATQQAFQAVSNPGLLLKHLNEIMPPLLCHAYRNLSLSCVSLLACCR